MTGSTNIPIRLAKTRQGEVLLYPEGELRYCFRFDCQTVGPIQRYLTAEEFHRLHDSAMGYEANQLPAKPIQLIGQSIPHVGLTVLLFNSMSRADLVELKELFGRAALMVTSLSRVWNDVN